MSADLSARLRHFLIADRAPGDREWQATPLFDGLSLFCEGGTLHRVSDATGQTLGLFAGDVIDIDRGVLEENEIRWGGTFLPDDRDGALESALYRYAGSWVFIAFATKRIYLDAGGTRSLVYEAATRRAASSAAVLLDAQGYEERLDRELYDQLDVEHLGWFAGELSAHHGIKRLLCNHYLDLATATVRRHWPTDDLDPVDDAAAQAIAIADTATPIARAAVESGSCAVGLTAGNETRFLLAVLRSLREQVQFFTVDSDASQLDIERARELAQRFDLKHRVLPALHADADQIARWDRDSGHCVGGWIRRFHRSNFALTDQTFLINGNAGELGRAFFWRSGDDALSRLDAGDLIDRLGMARHPRFSAAIETWLSSVSGHRVPIQLDLAYIELRLASWGAAGHSQTHLRSIAPLVSRPGFELLMRLPDEAKRTSAFSRLAIQARWPELLELPINRYGDYRDRLSALRKATDYRRVVTKLRKLGWLKARS